jgi:hypothetical protein
MIQGAVFSNPGRILRYWRLPMCPNETSRAGLLGTPQIRRLRATKRQLSGLTSPTFQPATCRNDPSQIPREHNAGYVYPFMKKTPQFDARLVMSDVVHHTARVSGVLGPFVDRRLTYVGGSRRPEGQVSLRRMGTIIRFLASLRPTTSLARQPLTNSTPTLVRA